MRWCIPAKDAERGLREMTRIILVIVALIVLAKSLLYLVTTFAAVMEVPHRLGIILDEGEQ